MFYLVTGRSLHISSSFTDTAYIIFHDLKKFCVTMDPALAKRARLKRRLILRFKRSKKHQKHTGIKTIIHQTILVVNRY